MSRKQRVLTGLGEIEAGLLKAAKTGSKKNVANLMRNLAITRDICREGLPENSYVKYGEIYDGLILAVEQMTKVKELRVNEEAFSLSMDLLRYIIRETERETNFKKDIFFLPYKASMWDALESVWKAAYEDKEHCNAYVMPIPYADLNPDGSVAEWHCERDQFPKYVPTLDWRDIDLKEWHPDVIFVHNPYDDYNLVTSVERRYYSRHLKECTDKLVYVPYFVLGEVYPWDEMCEENIKHFILTPAVLNSDITVVESEKMRQVYINVLARYTDKDRYYWETKIRGFGSPKIDKVKSLTVSEFSLPIQWSKEISGKKIILYNTSLSGVLKFPYQFLDKIKDTINTFKYNKNFTLWWRPHPLMEATLSSIHPELLSGYQEIVKKFKEDGRGIYDDTCDFHRAIAISDVYYGDRSSVATLYAVTRKPVLIQNYLITNSKYILNGE